MSVDVSRTITVVITTYKRPDTLKRAIYSSLCQDGISTKAIEVVVVDDNNPEDEFRRETELVMSVFSENDSVKYVKHDSNKNGAAARNTGIGLARGEYITFLDDDDVFMPSRFLKMISVLDSDTECDAVYSGYALARNEKTVEVVVPRHPEDEVYSLLCQESFFGTGSNFICRTSKVKELNGFDERFERHQDIEFMIRFLSKFMIRRVEEVLVVKCVDSKINVPSALKMERVKRLFIDEFEGIISKYSKGKQASVYRSNYLELARVIAWNNKKPSPWAAEMIERYAQISLRDSLLIAMKRIQARFTSLDGLRYFVMRSIFTKSERKVSGRVLSRFSQLKGCCEEA